jgi:cobaltochelatase CobN
VATVGALRGTAARRASAAPLAPRPSRTRTLVGETSRAFRSRVVNPKWIGKPLIFRYAVSRPLGDA